MYENGDKIQVDETSDDCSEGEALDVEHEEVEEGDSGPPLKRKKTGGSWQKYRQAWEKRFPWVRPIEGDPTKAKCTICGNTLVAQITPLKRHEQSMRHLKRLEQGDDFEIQQVGYDEDHGGPIYEYVMVEPQGPALNLLPPVLGFDSYRVPPNKVVTFPCDLKAESSLTSSEYDGIILVTDCIGKLHQSLSALQGPLKAQEAFDESVSKEGTCVKVDLPAGRLIYAPTGPVNRDYDDVRRFGDAAASGMKRAIKVGVKKPLLVTSSSDNSFPHADLVTLLGALHALYVPLEIREDVPEKKTKVKSLGFLGSDKVVQLAIALESGRSVARDIGGSDPERMAPPKVEEYVKNIFQGSKIKINVVADDERLCKDYPLFSAVNRCAKGVQRHKGRVIYLTYEGTGPIEKTLMLVGKGVTYDTGGADIKAGGIMAGMHRDKCGSAAVAGFMQIVNKLQPKNLKVFGSMAMVRNSVGSECYVADEIITSRAGVRVRVGNTDAEGRMAMADVLCHMKEMADKEVNPHLMTIATLTGHCVLAYGECYSAIMDNGPAQSAKIGQNLQAAGDEVADPFEISSIRREDYDFHAGKSEYEDVLQCNNAPSSRTARGHQTPSAFLVLSSGLDKHGKDSSKPLKYSHLDIAGSSGPFPGIPTGAPILALAKYFIPSAF